MGLEEILIVEPKLKLFKSNILSHKSIYNSGNEMTILYDTLSRLGKCKGKLYFFEHFFMWVDEYFKHYMNTMELLMNDDYIPKTWRNYIAIMAVSTSKCEYLLRILEENFLASGGDESWLVLGLDVVPAKVNKLARINNILAHQPWKIISDDIKV